MHIIINNYISHEVLIKHLFVLDSWQLQIQVLIK